MNTQEKNMQHTQSLYSGITFPPPPLKILASLSSGLKREVFSFLSGSVAFILPGSFIPEGTSDDLSYTAIEKWTDKKLNFINEKKDIKSNPANLEKMDIFFYKYEMRKKTLFYMIVRSVFGT